MITIKIIHFSINPDKKLLLHICSWKLAKLNSSTRIRSEVAKSFLLVFWDLAIFSFTIQQSRRIVEMSNISTITIAPIIVNLNIARAGIQRYGQPTLFAVGVVGCFLNILIFLRPSMRHNSCAIYFHASSWANLSCLCWGVLASMLVFFTGNNPASYSIVYCRIRFYMVGFSQYASRAFLILACLDRFLLCSTSVCQRQFCRVNVAKKMVPLATFICACLPMSVLITYGPVNKLRPCMVATEAGYIVETIIDYMFVFTLPTVSMTVLSSLTVRRLRQNARRVGRDKVSALILYYLFCKRK